MMDFHRQTDADGCFTDLLPAELRLQPCVCKVDLDTGDYFEKDKRHTSYPVVEASFNRIN